MSHRPDPTRRNRNIGTAKQGHGRDNRANIPRRWREAAVRWRRDHPHSLTYRDVWGRVMPFVVEHTRADCVHACTVDDVARVLNLLPKRHINNYRGIDGLQGIVLRQPTRKEATLRPVWARLGYGVDVGGVIGPVVFLEAQALPLEFRWGKSLDAAGRRERELLVSAADAVRHTRRGDELHFELEGVRRVQLFHSLPHEVGHWADMYERVERPALDDVERWEVLWDRYFQRPVSEREEFAHRYAEDAAAQWRASGSVPFDRLLDAERLRAEGLRVEDFVPRGPVA